MKKIILSLAALLSFSSPALAQTETATAPPAAVNSEAAAAAQTAAAVEATLKPTKPAVRMTGNRDAEGYFQWKVVGIRNMRIYQGPELVRHSQVLAMRKAGLTEAEVTEVVTALNNKTAEEGLMTKGMRFGAMSYSTSRGVVVQRKVKYVGEETHRIWRVRTSGGRVITIVEKCDNIGLEEAPPPPPAPPIVEVPPTPVPPPLDVPPPLAAKRFCDNWRLNLVVGAELELAKGMSRSVYGAWGVYCMKLVKGGQIGFGPAGQLAAYGGDPGRGHFDGHLIGAGLGVLSVRDSGHDTEAKLMGMHFLGRYNESDYRQKETRWGVGVSVAHNNYRGRLDGTGRPETQLFGQVFLPLGGNSEHSWQGQDLGKSSVLKLSYNLGARQYLLKEDPKRKWNPYVQAGILGEIRSGEDYFSCSIRIGVTNKRRTMGVHAGVNACNGGIVPAIGAWYDIGTDIRLARAERRAKAIASDNGEGRQATTTFVGRRLLATRE